MLAVFRFIRSLLSAIAQFLRPKPVPVLQFDPYLDTFQFSSWHQNIAIRCPNSLKGLLEINFCAIDQHLLFISQDPDEVVSVDTLDDLVALFVSLETIGTVRSLTVVEPSKIFTLKRVKNSDGEVVVGQNLQLRAR